MLCYIYRHIDEDGNPSRVFVKDRYLIVVHVTYNAKLAVEVVEQRWLDISNKTHNQYGLLWYIMIASQVCQGVFSYGVMPSRLCQIVLSLPLIITQGVMWSISQLELK